MKILCIDGGGIFGYLPAYVLSKVPPEDLPDFVALKGQLDLVGLVHAHQAGERYGQGVT